MILYSTHRYADAESAARQLIQAWPSHDVGWKALGTILGAGGRYAEALPVLQRALQLSPSDPETHNNLGSTLRALDRADEAEASYRLALDLNPDSHEAHSNLGGLLGGLGRLIEAEECCRRALALNPEFSIAHNNLGNVLAKLERFPEAEANYRRALEMNPSYHEAYSNLGNVLSELGRFKDAEAAFRRALEIKPDYHGAYNNLGNALKAQGSLPEAHASYLRALELNPNSHEALNNLGNFLRDVGSLTEAEASYRRAIEIRPGYYEAHTNLGNALLDLGRLTEAQASYRRALELKPDHSSAYSNLLFLVACTGLATGAKYLELARDYEVRAVPAEARAAAARKSFVRSPRGGRKLRIGYVSGDFRAHPVSYFMAGILGFHDRSRIEVFAYPTFGVEDAVTKDIRRNVDHWHGLSGVTDEEAVGLISRDQIDVLIDLSGHTGHNRMGVFARRAAPVQCHYLGYFASTGLSEMDYWIGDPVLVPENHDDQFSEEIWRLPRVWVSYASPANAPAPTWLPRSRGKVCLGSFNHLGKITERTIALWAKVLHRVPKSHLLLKTKELDDLGNQARMRANFNRHGIADERIELLGRTADWATHMSLYDRLDIALDPVGGIAGGTTTCDALWMSVPVVALAGQRHAERMTTSMLAAIGYAEWAAASEDEYVELVAKLAANTALRKRLRFSLRDTMRKSPLSDAKGLARALEDAYESMFDRWITRRG